MWVCKNGHRFERLPAPDVVRSDYCYFCNCGQDLFFEEFKRMEDKADKLIRRDIVLSVARQSYLQKISHITTEAQYLFAIKECFEAAEIWADCQIKYCKEVESD